MAPIIQPLKRYLRERAGGYSEFRRQTKLSDNGQISLLNQAGSDLGKKSWLENFILKRGLLSDSAKTVTIGTLYGPRAVLGWAKSDLRIFFSGENLHLARWSHYADYMLSGPNPYNLGLGFDLFEDDNYLRLPLWIMYLFPPESTKEDIRRICSEIRFPKDNSGEKFCSLISRWDPNGIRREIYDALSPMGQIDCPSAFNHNDDSLKTMFNDNKINYLKQYRFNICPENSDALGYTTEKVFQSISAGCIPVYYGSFGSPEPGVVNGDCIMQWSRKDSNAAVVAKIDELESNRKLFEDFASQPRLADGAEDIICGYFADLENRIERLIKK